MEPEAKSVEALVVLGLEAKATKTYIFHASVFGEAKALPKRA
jgi:hypothetical protein